MGSSFPGEGFVIRRDVIFRAIGERVEAGIRRGQHRNKNFRPPNAPPPARKIAFSAASG